MKTAKRKPARNGSAREDSGAAVTLAGAEKTFGLTVAKARELYDRLTERQRQVAGLMSRGLQNRAIAGQLGISPKTLDIHRADVYDRLKVDTPAGVARIVWLVALAEAAGA